MKIVFLARIIRNSLCVIYSFLLFFFQKSLLTEIIFWLLWSIWLPRVHCILVLFLSKNAIFCVFVVFRHFIFSRLPPQFEKVTEAFELKFGPNMPCRVFYKRCAAFFEKKIFDHFLAKTCHFWPFSHKLA